MMESSSQTNPSAVPKIAGPEQTTVGSLGFFGVSLGFHIGVVVFFMLLYQQLYRPTIFEAVKSFSLVSFPGSTEKPVDNSIKKSAPQRAVRNSPAAETTPVPAPAQAVSPAAQTQSASGSADSSLSINPAPATRMASDPTGYDESKITAIYKPDIQYPEVARQLGIEGRLVAILTINSKGIVENVDILESPHPSITRAAQKMLKLWKFNIAIQSAFGADARYLRRQEITFALDEQDSF